MLNSYLHTILFQTNVKYKDFSNIVSRHLSDLKNVNVLSPLICLRFLCLLNFILNHHQYTILIRKHLQWRLYVFIFKDTTEKQDDSSSRRESGKQSLSGYSQVNNVSCKCVNVPLTTWRSWHILRSDKIWSNFYWEISNVSFIVEVIGKLSKTK